MFVCARAWIPGDAEGDGGLHRSSYSGEQRNKLLAQLSGDVGEKLGGPLRWESGDRPYLSADSQASSSGRVSASEDAERTAAPN